MGLPGLWMARRALFSKTGKGAQEEPHRRLKAEIQVVSGVPRATASSVQKFFPPSHREPTRKDPELLLRGRGQRGPGSWAEACEEAHHSGGRRQVPPGRVAAGERRLGRAQAADECLWGEPHHRLACRARGPFTANKLPLLPTSRSKQIGRGRQEAEMRQTDNALPLTLCYQEATFGCPTVRLPCLRSVQHGAPRRSGATHVASSPSSTAAGWD